MTLYCGTHNWLCVQKMLNHGLNHVFFLSLFKLISCKIHWIVCVLAYLNFKAVFVLPKTASSAQTHKNLSFVWIVWSTLYEYLWSRPDLTCLLPSFALKNDLAHFRVKNKTHLKFQSLNSIYDALTGRIIEANNLENCSVP